MKERMFMSIAYKPNYCANCKRLNCGKMTSFQYFLYCLLLILGIIPGIIYYFCAKPSRCYICGLKKRHRSDKFVDKKM